MAVRGLDGLIRLHRWDVTEKRRALAALERIRAGHLQDLVDLEAAVRDEQQAAARAPDATGSYGAYAFWAIGRRAEFSEKLEAVDGEIAVALQALADAFQVLKRYELVRRNRKERERAAADRRDQAVEDEVALNVHRRGGRRA